LPRCGTFALKLGFSAMIQTVLIRCPETGAAVSTVHRMRETEFEALTGERAFRCPRCRQVHTWTKDVAWQEKTPAVA
jgi:hypothetical protein